MVKWNEGNLIIMRKPVIMGNDDYAPSANLIKPYLPPMKNPLLYTLILDLDETLIHYCEVL